MKDDNQKSVCIQFSGGSDSTLTAYRMSIEYDRVHLLTFKHNGLMDIENSMKSYAILNEKFPNKLIHTMVDINDMFVRIYNRQYLRNLIKYRTLQLQFQCFACQACFHINTIIYCLQKGIHDVRDGANTEYEEASPMQIEIVKKEIKRLYADYGIHHDSPVYHEYENARSDHQLYQLGLRSQPDIKDDPVMHKAYQGYCRYMPSGVIFLNYWKSCEGFPDRIQMGMKEHWLEEVEYFKQLIDEGCSKPL